MSVPPLGLRAHAAEPPAHVTESPAREGRGRRGRHRGAGRLAALVLSSALLVWGCGSEDDLEGPTPLFDEVPIEYPLSLWDEGVEGTTMLRVRVTETGVVDSTLVLESSGHEAFDSAAVRGGRRLRFDPATRDGEQVSVWAHVPVRFSLDGSDASGSRP